MRSSLNYGAIILMFGGLLATAHAAPAPICKTKAWKGSANAPLRSMKKTFDRMPRREVVQLAWGEMLKSDQNKSVAMPALQYLAGTEQTKAVRGYFKTMSMVMSRGRLPSENLKKWPTRVPASKPNYTLKQLCEMYAKAGGH